MKNKVVVVGSCNVDHRIKAERMPSRGETLIGGTFSMGGGGKGANQAVAAARAGAAVSFIAKVGNDVYGDDVKHRLTKESINVQHVVQDPDAATGVAFIIVDEHGENTIVVAPGANAHLNKSDIERARNELETAKVLLVQLESPMEAVGTAVDIARRKGAIIILNPAPAQSWAKETLNVVDILTPNIIEAEMLSGEKITNVESLQRAAELLLELGTKTVIITLGKQGVFFASGDKMHMIPPFEAHAVDSTGAGDVFSGALAAFLAKDVSIEDSVKMANAAASISVTKLGAQSSAPYLTEIDDFLEKNEPFEIENVIPFFHNSHGGDK